MAMKFYQPQQVIPERFSAPAPLAMGTLLQPLHQKLTNKLPLKRITAT
jgi:hypothetical protein